MFQSGPEPSGTSFRGDALLICGSQSTAIDTREERAVILPAPLGSAPGLGHCSDRGPAAILSAMGGDVPEDLRDTLAGIHQARPLNFKALDQEGAVDLIKESISTRLERDQFVLLVGGEHTVTLGAAMALCEAGEDFGVVYLDAHADLKSGIGRIRLTHATVARRLVEEGIPVAGIGWRSFDAREYEFWRRNSMIVRSVGELREDPSLLAGLLDTLPERIYLSVDIDVLDPAVMPATGVPEPDGLSLRELERLLEKIFDLKTVIGADLVELSPLSGKPRPNLTAAWLALKVVKMALGRTGSKAAGSGLLELGSFAGTADRGSSSDLREVNG